MKKIFLIAFSIVVVLSAHKFFSLPKIQPTLSFPDAQGYEHTVLNLRDNQYGVIAYFSKTPCNGHITAGHTYLQTVKALHNHPRYKLFVIYGDDKSSDAVEFVRKYNMPFLLDIEKTFAKKYKIKYYAVLIFNSAGKILDLTKGAALSSHGDIEHMNNILRKKGLLK